MATFTNQATLSYNGGVTNSNIVTGELVEVLSAVKTAVTDTYTPEGTVTYLIHIVNTGTVPYTGLTLTDDLGAYLLGEDKLVPLTYEDGSVKVFVNGVLQAAPTVISAVPLIIDGITVPAGGITEVAYAAAINRYAPLATGGTIVNTATISGARLTTPLTVTETITVAEAARLSISKEISPTTVSENARLTYTFRIRNYGNTAATEADNAVISDTFDPRLSDLTVTYNGTPWTAGTDYVYDAETGIFTSVAGRVTVGAATFATDPVSGAVAVTPGVGTLIVSGIV